MCFFGTILGTMSQKRLLTGVQSSGQLHIGNYFGALKPFRDVYTDYESMLMVADYHSITSVRDPELLRSNTLDAVRDYLAIGIDPEKAIIFKQSDVLEHMELGWIFDCLVTVPFLMQAHAYKDRVAKGLEANAGLFTYPMLMAADILLYDTDVVPVGEDQRQHIEYAREAATKFNNTYGDTFIEPKELILSDAGVVPGTDGQKMSKSYKNTIPLFGSKDAVAKAVMSIVTDSSGERPENVYAIHSLVRPKTELEPLYTEHAGSYKVLKEALIEDLESVIDPMRTKRESISDADIAAVLARGKEAARAQAAAKMATVRKRIGITL